jgi:hypothetical protein
MRRYLATALIGGPRRAAQFVHRFLLIGTVHPHWQIASSHKEQRRTSTAK